MTQPLVLHGVLAFGFVNALNKNGSWKWLKQLVSWLTGK